MAPWQFKTEIIPRRTASESRDKVIVASSQSLGDEDGNADLWLNYAAPGRLEKSLSNILPEVQSWSVSARMFGDSKGDRIEIWKKEGHIDWIMIAFSLSQPRFDFVKAAIATVNEHDCLFFDLQAKIFFEPVLSDFVGRAEKCSAARYIPAEMHLSSLLK